MTTPDKKSPRRELLEEAADLIDGDRNVSYGSPTQNFTNIAELWNTRFSHMLKDGEKFTASDVADAQILVKVARNIAGKKRDNWADIAGYAGCGYEASLPPEESEKPDGLTQPKFEFHVTNPSVTSDPVLHRQLVKEIADDVKRNPRRYR